jgi:8-oxo-dGTP pyrophosphatase MutT (NUDIX family)
MITKLRNILGLSTLEENLARYNSVSEDIQYINSQTDDLSEHYYSKMSNYNHILKSDEYSDEIKKSVKTRYDNFLQDQKKIVVGLVNKRHKLEKELSNLLKNDSLNKAVQELNSIEKAKGNYKSGKISKNVYNDIIKAKKGKVHYSDNFVFWNGKLLLIQRATDDTNANTWVVPGGHVDAGESHVDAAVRELQEETGLVVDNVVLAGTYSNDDVMIEYYTSHIDSDVEPQLTLDTSEHQSYRWIDLYRENIDEFEFPFNIKENIKKLLLPKEEKPQDISKAVNMFIDGFISKEVLSDIVKARTGKYADTSENRRLKRVGQSYGSKKGEDTKEIKEPSKQEETGNKEGKDIPIDQHARQSSEIALQEAAKGGDEELRMAAKKELDRREKEESVSDQPEKENVSAGTEKKPGGEKPPVSEKGKDDYDSSIKELENKIRELRSADIDYSDEKAMEENTKQVQEAMKERQRLVSERDSLRKVGFEEYMDGFKDFTGNTTEAGERYREESESIKKYLSENKKQKHSLDEYKFESYAPIREVLSSGKLSGSYEIYADDGAVDITEDAVNDMIKDISSFISENKIKDNLVLNRRVKGNEAIKFFNSLKKGEMYEDKSYSSTSLVELPHFGEYNIQILAKKGSSVANIDNLGEREYLIDKGAKFRVLEKGEESIIVELL